MVGAKPEVQRIVRAEQFGRAALAAVFAQFVRRRAVAVVDLEEVKVAVGAALQVEEGKRYAENLKKETQNREQEDSLMSHVGEHAVSHWLLLPFPVLLTFTLLHFQTSS